MDTPPPIKSAELFNRGKDAKRRQRSKTQLSVSEFTLPKGGELSLVRDERFADLVRIKCPVGPEGMPPRKRRDVKGIKLDPRKAGRHMEVREIKGVVPEGSAVSHLPKEAERARVQDHLDIKPEDGKLIVDPKTGERLDKGGSIFGADDRYLFNDRAFPWRTTGLIRTAAGRCSGTTIGPRHVLTASHCVNWNSDGGAGWITFTPGFFDGDEPWGEIAATNVVYWIQAPGSLTDQQTAFDYVVLVMEENIGDIVGYPGTRTYDDDWNDGEFWQYIGYPGELAGGQRPAFQGDCVVSSTASHSQGGNDATLLGHFNEFTPGQSGGAIWGWWDDEPWPRVVGVGSTIGDTTVKSTSVGTNGDNEYGGGPALTSLVSWARSNFPALTS